MRREWRDFGLALLGAALSAAVLAGLATATAPGVDDAPLLGMLPKLALVLMIWLVGWPVWETVRAVARSRQAQCGAWNAARRNPVRAAAPRDG